MPVGASRYQALEAEVKVPSTLDLILWGIVAAAAAGLLLTVNHWRTQAAEFKDFKVETKRTLAAKDHLIEVERDNTRKANESSNRFESRMHMLEDQRTADGFGAIRVCRRPIIRMPTAGAATTEPDDAGLSGDAGADEVSVDVGPAAELYGTRCEANAIKLDALQEWVRGR